MTLLAEPGTGARLLGIVVLALGSACSPPDTASPEASAPAAAEVPPPEARPPGIPPSLKWLPESPRYQYARRTHYETSLQFRKHVDLATRQVSRQGHYRAEVRQRHEPVALGEFQSWLLAIETPDGKPVRGAELGISGGMPQHGHGMPSSPRYEAGPNPGEYRIDGLQFSMPGWWEVSVFISKDKVGDTVTFNLLLE